MSEKRFEVILNEFDEVEYIMDKKLCEDKDFVEFMDFVEELARENEQLRQQLQEYKKNWDEIVEMATKTSLRNVELDEQIGQLQQGIRIAYEKKPYPTFEDIQNEINNDIMMSEDIHKWTDGRYTLMFDEHTFFVWDNEKDERMCALETTKRLNKQQATIQQLQAKLREKEQDERLYANEIVKLNKEAKEVLDFKNLGGDY